MNEWDRMVAIEQTGMSDNYAGLWRALGQYITSITPQGEAVLASGVDLAKAESTTAATWLFSDVHIAHAADRIAALINSKPRSPTKAEIIEAIHGGRT